MKEYLGITNEEQTKLNARLVLILFNRLYQDKLISLKEYKLLCSNTRRTFNLKEI